ncbi:MAG TPA: hypothetical protein VEK14_06140 [Rhodomicrobium sp.]|nr:hypothetical protein [Rhodomicrobium sp.]
MPLQRIEGEIAREAYGFAFPMRIAGTAQTVRVIVSDEVSTALGWPVDEVLRAQVDEDRSELEVLASEKYEHGRASADGIVSIALSDVVSLFQ